MLVPTMDTVRYSSLLENLFSIEKPVFITGCTGIGKSVIVQSKLNSLREQGD